MFLKIYQSDYLPIAAMVMISTLHSAQKVDHLVRLKEAIEAASALKFNYEPSNNCRLPFLDVLVDDITRQYFTSVTKILDLGCCRNATSECS